MVKKPLTRIIRGSLKLLFHCNYLKSEDVFQVLPPTVPNQSRHSPIFFLFEKGEIFLEYRVFSIKDNYTHPQKIKNMCEKIK